MSGQIQGLAGFPGLVHGFSSKIDGDCHVHHDRSLWPNLNSYLKKYEIAKKDLVLMEQVHGRQIKTVGKNHTGKMVKGVDGMLTADKNVYLAVKTADCLPLFYFDPVREVVGIAHAGWRGVVLGIGIKMVDRMILMGCLPSDIIIGIGPCLCDRCHWQPKPVIQQQMKEWVGYWEAKGDKVNVRLKKYCRDRLLESGIRQANIYDVELCTYEKKNEFFSYQAAKETGSEQKEGRMISLIGMKKEKRN